MFIPSTRIWREMQFEPVGFWPVPMNSGDEYVFLTKIPTHVIKAAYRSVPITLTVATAQTPVGDVIATVLVIADDQDSPLAISGVHRHPEEQLALTEVLRAGNGLVVFFDELSRPIARAHCSLDPDACGEMMAELGTHRKWYSGPWIPVLAELLDEVDALVDPTKSAQPRYLPTLRRVTLTLTSFASSKITAVGACEADDFWLEDPDEGHGLEQTTWQLLEHLFGQHIFHSPNVQEQKAARELTDIMGFCESGICLVEAKAMAVLSTSTDRGTDRRTKNVRKQIDKGVTQLPGAMRNLAAGLPLSSKSNQEIQIPECIGPLRVGVIMVSELLPSVDWDHVARQLIEAARTTNASLVVLDLQELRLLVGISNTPATLMRHLVDRFQIMNEQGSAFIRTRLNGPPPP
jgi:hypothetical protein